MNRLAIAFVLLIQNAAYAKADWEKQTIATTADLRGLCVVDTKIIWASGSMGTYLRTADGGAIWTSGTVPDTDKLDFRDVQAFGGGIAYLMSAGPGEGSRIYKTTDDGKTWRLQHKNAEPQAFFDSIAFWDEQHGIVLSDPVDNHFLLLTTADGGKTWNRIAADKLPPALTKEGAFAASGTCLVTHGDKDVWFATGGARSARVFHSADRGQTWTVSDTPIQSGIESAGIFGIAFRDNLHGMIVGGDYRKPKSIGATAAITSDGGKTWTLLENALPFRSGATWANDRWIVVGTSGSDSSQDNGKTWKLIDLSNYNAVGCSPSGQVWAVGPKGRVAKYER